MRILHITPEYHASPLYENLRIALQQRGVTQRVYVADNRGLELVRDGEVEQGILTYPKAFNLLERLAFFPKDRQVTRYFETDVQDFRPELIHAHKLFAGGSQALYYKQHYGIPYIVALRNTEVNSMLPYMPWLRPLARQILQESRRIILISPSYRAKLQGLFRPDAWQAIQEKIEVIPNGIDPVFLSHLSQHEPDKDCIRLIYIGRMEANKNILAILHTADRLVQEGHRVSLRLVGDMTDEALSQPIRARNYVQYFPKCTHEEVIRHLREADIFLMPSRKETFGLVYIEAMSQGLPVIYTRGQGIDGYFAEGEVGYSVLPDDIESIVTAVKNIRQHYSAMSQHCVSEAAAFDWQRIAERYLSIYNSSIGQCQSQSQFETAKRR